MTGASCSHRLAVPPAMRSDGMHVVGSSFLVMSKSNLYEVPRVRRVVKLGLGVSEVEIAIC